MKRALVALIAGTILTGIAAAYAAAQAKPVEKSVAPRLAD